MVIYICFDCKYLKNKCINNYLKAVVFAEKWKMLAVLPVQQNLKNQET